MVGEVEYFINHHHYLPFSNWFYLFSPSHLVSTVALVGQVLLPLFGRCSIEEPGMTTCYVPQPDNTRATTMIEALLWTAPNENLEMQWKVQALDAGRQSFNFN